MTDTRTTDEVIASLEAKVSEQRYLIEVLALWRHAEKAGYTSNCIKHFTFRGCFLSHEERRELGWGPHPYTWPDSHLNCVRLVDGSLAEIPLYPRPRKP